MDIIVTLKQVPDPEAPKESFRIDDTAMKILNPANVDPVINGFDENAIEAALKCARPSAVRSWRSPWVRRVPHAL